MLFDDITGFYTHIPHTCTYKYLPICNRDGEMWLENLTPDQIHFKNGVAQNRSWYCSLGLVLTFLQYQDRLTSETKIKTGPCKTLA